MTDSAFARAAQAASQGNATASDTDGNLTQSFAGESSQLFSAPVLPPSLVNKTHGIGSVRTGVIAEKPYDVHARDYNTKLPKYFLATPINEGGKTRKVGPVAVDPNTGKPNQPVKDTVVILNTDYRFDANEAAAVGRDTTLGDDGKRAHYVSGDDLKQLRKEIQRLGLRSEDEMVGLTYTVKRVGQKPNSGGNPSWITEITLSR